MLIKTLYLNTRGQWEQMARLFVQYFPIYSNETLTIEYGNVGYNNFAKLSINSQKIAEFRQIWSH